MLYTAIIGDRDKAREDIKVFSAPIVLDNRRMARQYKILSHQYINEEYSLWIDGNIDLKIPAEVLIPMLIEKYLKDADMATMVHPSRDCVYQEAETCKLLGLDLPEVIDAQMAKYRAEGYPEHNGMVATSFVLRRHTPQIEAFNNAWFSELCCHSKRDQLSFNYVCWKLGMKYNLFDGAWQDNPYFIYNNHNA
jgi:hypothetical protein